MSASLYESLVSSALDCVKSDIIIDCAIGKNCLGIQMDQGIGLAFTTAEAWSLASSMPLPEQEQQYRECRLGDTIADYLGSDPLAVNVALAAMNSVYIHKGEPDNLNWFEWLRGKKKLGMVGYFCPIMERVAFAGVEPVIFELRDIPGTHRPAEAAELMPGCDAVLITGATFANKSVHTYLPHIAPDAEAFIFGHSTPLADSLLERFTIGSCRVLNKDKVFETIRRGGGIRDMKEHICKVICRKKT